MAKSPGHLIPIALKIAVLALLGAQDVRYICTHRGFLRYTDNHVIYNLVIYHLRFLRTVTIPVSGTKTLHAVEHAGDIMHPILGDDIIDILDHLRRRVFITAYKDGDICDAIQEIGIAHQSHRRRIHENIVVPLTQLREEPINTLGL